MATVFLDLDGTLVDPAPGITGAFARVLDELGHDVPAALTWIIGPALIDSFAALGVADPEAALAAYRRHYRAGAIFDLEVYPGIPEALTALREAGHVLHLATAKPHVFARRITARFGLDRHLGSQFGPELDGTRNDKGALLAHALGKLGHGAEGCVMIGDRVHDIRAARAVGMAALAVSWGYGSAAEHEAADALCARPADLPGAVAALI